MLKMTKERLSFGTRYYIEAFFFSRRRTSLNGIVGSFALAGNRAQIVQILE